MIDPENLDWKDAVDIAIAKDDMELLKRIALEMAKRMRATRAVIGEFVVED